jgi:NADP-dependent 3-hydroxy acid dehydrogenase YdfG
MKTVAFVGRGELVNAFINQFSQDYQYVVFSKPEYDITDQDLCNQLAKKLLNFDVVIFAAGLCRTTDIWNQWIVNTVAPCTIMLNLINNKFTGQVIVISSNGANWHSWPGVDTQRLNYNNSKLAVSNFVKGLEQSDLPGNYCVFEPSAFKSKMNQGNGHNIEKVASCLKFCIENQVYNVTMSKYN